MKLLRSFRGHVHATPKSAYRKLCDELEADGITILARNDDERTLAVGGQWWFHGAWSVVPDGDGARVTLDVSTKRPVVAFLASRAIKRTLTRIEAGWDDDLATLAQPL